MRILLPLTIHKNMKLGAGIRIRRHSGHSPNTDGRFLPHHHAGPGIDEMARQHDGGDLPGHLGNQTLVLVVGGGVGVGAGLTDCYW